MNLIHKTSDPVEASFVKNFFQENGRHCEIVPSAASYGMQLFDVYVDGEIDTALLAKLQALLDAVPPADADEEEIEPPPPESQRSFSLAEILFILFVAELMRQSFYLIVAQAVPGTLSRFGLGFIADACVFLLLWIVTKRKLGNAAAEFFGLVPLARGLPLLFWLVIVGVYTVAEIYCYRLFPGFFPRHRGLPMFLPVALLLAPVFEELMYRGFLLEALRRSVGLWPALLASSVLFGLAHYQYPLAYALVIAGGGFLAGLARVKTGSIIVPIGMHALQNFLAYTVHF